MPFKSILFCCFLLFIVGCISNDKKNQESLDFTVDVIDSIEVISRKGMEIEVQNDIKLANYFEWMENTIASLNDTLSYQIDEYNLVHANPWIIDTLANTDYYYQKSIGQLIKDPKEMIALLRGVKLHVPDSIETSLINNMLQHSLIDVNIPEFKLRIYEDTSLVYSCDVRVGKNDKQFLAMVGRDVDQRTYPGEGVIARINKKPSFINPKDNHRYYVTKRDDGQVTKLPNIPWLEPELNGKRYGHLIHPTTNIETLGKAASNGCIGLSEASAWRVYYHAPLGTKIVVRYDLDVIDKTGNEVRLKDIYPELGRLFDFATLPEIVKRSSNGQTTEVCICTSS